MKDIKDYLPFYLGSQFRYRYVDYGQGQWAVWSELNTGRLHKLFHDLSIEIIQLALRPLSDMTEEEIKCLFKIKYCVDDFHGQVTRVGIDGTFIQLEGIFKGEYWNDYQDIKTLYPKQVAYLLKQGFDLFGLIEAGLAIDLTKLNKEK